MCGMSKDLDILIYFINARTSKVIVIPTIFSLPIKSIFLRIFNSYWRTKKCYKYFSRSCDGMNVLTRQMARSKLHFTKVVSQRIVATSTYLTGTKSSYVSGRSSARIAVHHTPRKAFSFRIGQDRSMGRHREGEPRAFSGITLWRAADVHPCSCPYLLPFLPSPTPLWPFPRVLTLSLSILWTRRPQDLGSRIFTIRP